MANHGPAPLFQKMMSSLLFRQARTGPWLRHARMPGLCRSSAGSAGTRERRTTPVHMTAPKVKTAPGLNFGAATALTRQKSALRELNFEALGVGGLGDELQAVLHRAFVSRLAEPALIESLGIRHTKGILIHGPPGTGKTLLARKLARALGARPPKLVNGPEIFQLLNFVNIFLDLTQF